MNTDLEITLEFLDSPTEVDFYAVAGAPGRDGADGQDGADGHTPVITASKQGKVTTISVDGSAIAQIDDGADGATGAKGDKGDKGDPGQDGAKGDKGDTGAKGDKGDKGDTGAQGIQGIQGEKGETGAKGDKGDKGDTGATGAAGQDGHTPVKGTDYWTAEDKAEIVEDVTEEIDLSDYVQKTDYASSSAAGVAKVGDYGVTITGDNVLRTKYASSSKIKAGNNGYDPIVPNNQHESAFYGLAKAAGDSTQSASSNTVGNYTDAAKQAIRQMLGLPKNIYAELIADVTTTEDLTQLIINTDTNGEPFALRKARIYIKAPMSTTGSNSYIAADYLNDYANTYLNFGTCQLNGSSQKVVVYEYEGFGAYSDARFYTMSDFGNSGSFGGYVAYRGINSYAMKAFKLSQYNSTSTLIPSGSRITIYGIRY